MISTYEFIQKISYAEMPDENGKLRTIAIPETTEDIELVRCKDCKFHGHDCPYYFAYKRTAPDDWFCADGERKE